jgi:dienelactone hydrolase
MGQLQTGPTGHERTVTLPKRVAGATRREALFLPLLPLSLYAQTRFPGVAYRDYTRCLPDYLGRLAAEARSRRLQSLESLTSADAVRARQKWARRTFIDLIGPLPEKTPLNARTTGSFARDGYRLEKVVYESRPGFPVAANVYIPSGTPPFPGILFQMGHTENGKAGDTYQRACQGLARLGFLVLGFDPMGQGERINYPDSTGMRSRLGSADEEHTFPARQMLLVGDNCSALQLWDAVRSLDYLAGHPAVDPSRLASTGQSGGATLTMLLAAVDDRLSTAAVFSGNTENIACSGFLPPGSVDDAEQDFIGSGPAAFDRWDTLHPFAPKPLLISVSDKDFFGTYSPNYISDGWQEFERLKQVYRLLGREQDLEWTDTPLPHGLSYDSRMAMYRWMQRHLKRSEKPLDAEPSVEPEPDENLWVSPHGNLNEWLHGETPHSLTLKRYRDVSAKRRPAKLEDLLRVDVPRQVTPSVPATVASSQGVTISAIDVTNGGISLPAWLFIGPGANAKTRLIVVLEPQGRNRSWHEGQIWQTLAARGFTVCVADVRGIGDLAPAFSRGAPSYARSHQDDENYAWSSLILGRPLAGQRVTDILALVRGLKSLAGPGTVRIGIAARGAMTIPAICAASLDRSISGLYLASPLVSFDSIIASETYRYPFSAFIPNILAHTDLPEIAAALAPSRVQLAGAVNGTGAAVPVSEVNQVYAGALTRGHLSIRADEGWNASNLAGFFA